MRDWLEKLQKFRCNGISGVTEEEIVEKEKALGVTLPPILHELYQTYSPDDEIFTYEYGNKLIPLSCLELQKIEDKQTRYSVVFFCHYQDKSWGIPVTIFRKQERCLEECSISDQSHIFLYYRAPSGKLEGFITNQALEDWILYELSYPQIYISPNIVALDYYSVSVEDLKILRSYFVPLKSSDDRISLSSNEDILVDLLSYAAPAVFPKNCQTFGALSEQALTKLINETGFKFQWLKRNGIMEYEPPVEPEPFVPHKRELHSISPVLDFLRNFAGVDQPGCTEEDVQKAEKRFGGKLPLPVKEFYLKLPPEYMETNNCFRPLSSLRRRRDGKISFLVENQEVYHGAFALNSPFFYLKMAESGAKWEPAGILDGYLVSEFLWNLNAVPGLGFQSLSYPKFKPKMLEEGGELTQYFTDIAGISLKIGEENFMQLYQGFDGTVIGFYNKWTPSFSLLTRGEEHMNRAKELLGLNK